MELIQHVIDFFFWLIDFIIHVDVHLTELVTTFGLWTYALLFLIIFCETGLVVTPILPGDSLLFAAGALAALDGSPLDVYLLAPLLVIAAILGDASNYAIGRALGPKVFASQSSWLLNKKHLEHTQKFYDKHGGKTIILARFIPIVRTFAPFVAGIGRMGYRNFASYNVVGALLWVPPFLFAGYGFGQTDTVKHNFHLVIIAIIVISVIPGIVEFAKARRAQKRAEASA